MNEREQALENLQKTLEVELPADYTEFLLGYDGRQNYMHKKIRGKYWQLGSLCEEKGFHLLGSKFCNGLKMHADIIREYEKTDSTRVTGTRQRFSLDLLEKCIVIGYENGDSLFLNREDFSVWVFWHDGSDCQKLAGTFTEWLGNTKEEYDPIPEMITPEKFQHLIEKYAGLWKIEGRRYPSYLELKSDSYAKRHYEDDSGGEGQWRVIDGKRIGILIESKGYKLEEDKFTVINCTETNLDLDLKKHDYQVSYVKAEKIEF